MQPSLDFQLGGPRFRWRGRRWVKVAVAFAARRACGKCSVVDSAPNLTELIHRAGRGDVDAADRLFAATYGQLRTLARRRLGNNRRGTLLDTSALVHESYLRFVGSGALRLEDRIHFVRWAARAMRSVIVDFARRRAAARRGGAGARTTLTTDLPSSLSTGPTEILAVHEALGALDSLHPRMAQVVELRYFSGLTEPEIADVLGVTERTVRRDWEKARLFLRDALK
jgi:RNA polymerase sigma factor (TIGR02999 family)